MCYVMGYVQYCYVFVSDGMADDVLFVVIVAVKAFMAQLLSPRQISLNGTIKYIVLFCKHTTLNTAEHTNYTLQTLLQRC